MKDTKVIGKTESGFDFTIDVRVIQDMEFLEMLGEVDANPLLMPKLCEKMLGKTGKKALYDFVRDEDGFVTAEAIAPVVTGIMKAASEKSKEIKNS